MGNYVNLICTAILAITSVVNVLLLLYQINSNRQDEAKKFWYKVSINSDDLSNCTGYFNRIISIIENNQKRNDKLLAYKDEFKNIRNFFSKTIFFDEDMKNKLDEFIYECEQECMINDNIKKEDIKELFRWDEGEGCIATDRIMVDGEKVGYMYRENPDFVGDSGWRFTAGDEDDEYMSEPSHSGLYTLNVVANNDEDIIPFLNSPIGTAYYRGENGDFVKDTFNVIARQEIDGILYEYKIMTVEDYKNQSPENLAVIYENIKAVMEQYDLSEDDADAILVDLLGVYEE